MNTNQAAKNKGSNLSVTAKEQKGSAGAYSPGHSAQSARSRNGRYTTITKLPACSGGVCGISWKPNQHTG